MAQIVNFDPVKLLIIPVDTGGAAITVSVTEVYSEWKVWLKTGDNAKYPRAFRYVGSDPITDTQSLGATFFLLNGWRFRPVERDHQLTIEGNVFTDPAGGAISVPTVSAYTVTVRTSVSNLIDAVGTGGDTSAAAIADAVWDEAAADHALAGSFGAKISETATTASSTETLAGVIDSKVDIVDSKVDIVDSNVDQVLVDVANIEEFTPTDRTTLGATATDAAAAKTAAQSADTKLDTVDANVDQALIDISNIEEFTPTDRAKLDTVDANVDQVLVDVSNIEEFTPTDRTTLNTAATDAASAVTAAEAAETAANTAATEATSAASAANTAATSASLAQTAAENALAEAEVARKILHNRLEVDFTAQELVLYNDDGTTVYLRWPLDTDSGENVQVVTGAQTKRGAPV